jgi:DNA-binding transcriptional LysR family regulator
MFELRDLERFLAVAEQRNFGRAAAVLGMSQPPLTRQIHALERDLGVQLFSRARRQIELTPAGRALVREARALLAQARVAAQTTREAADGTSGRLRVGYRGVARFRIVPVAIRLMRERLPNASVTLAESMTALLHDHVRARLLDMGILSGPVTAEGLCTATVSRSTIVLAVPVRHRLSKRTVVDVEDIAEESFVEVLSYDALGYHALVRGVCAQAGFVPRVVQEVDSVDTAAACVAAGVGISLVCAHLDVPFPGVVYRPLRPPGPRVDIVAIWREDDDNPLIRPFVSSLQQAAREDGTRRTGG